MLLLAIVAPLPGGPRLGGLTTQETRQQADDESSSATTTVKALLMVLGLDAGTSDGQLLDRVTGLKTAEAELLACRARIADLEGKAAKQAEAVKR